MQEKRSVTVKYVLFVCFQGATENAEVKNAIRAKLQGWKMQEWKKQEYIAGVENAGVNRMEHQPEIEKTSSYFVGLVLILLTE